MKTIVKMMVKMVRCLYRNAENALAGTAVIMMEACNIYQ